MNACRPSKYHLVRNNVDWLRHRALGQPLRRHLTRRAMRRRTTTDTVANLKLESTLDGHLGCVNCLAWDQSGRLLVSGSDDCNVILWNPFSQGQRRSVVRTGHSECILSVKFIHHSTNSLIATCARDQKVKLIDSTSGATLIDCSQCHSNCVRQLATHPHEPHLLWSAAEDGQVRQYDTRLEHRCSSSNCSCLLIDLKSMVHPSLSGAKCLALNPLKSDMLIVGSSDPFVRIFDRRFIRSNVQQDTSGSFKNFQKSMIAYFAPAHLAKQANQSWKTSDDFSHDQYGPVPISARSLGITHLSFNSDGSEILVNVHADHIYLFNTYQPLEGYKSFEADVKPFLSRDDELSSLSPAVTKVGIHPYSIKKISLWRSLREQAHSESKENHEEVSQYKSINLPKEFGARFEQIRETLTLGKLLSMADFNELNEMLSKAKYCSELYNLRAEALYKRSWRGDYYEAIRDCCCALALDPGNTQTLCNMIMISSKSTGWTSGHSLVSRFGQLLKEKCGIEEDWLRSTTMSIPAQLLRTIWHLPPTAYDPNNHLEHRASGDSHVTSRNSDELASQWELNFDNYPRGQPISRGGADGEDDENDELLRMKMTQIEIERRTNSLDYSKRFYGHCNMMTEIKEANLFGEQDEFIVAGSDDGGVFIWDKHTSNIVVALNGDSQVVNCVQPHPNICMLATSGIDSTVKLWSPVGKISKSMSSLERKVNQNQKFILSDPLEAMVMTLGPS